MARQREQSVTASYDYAEDINVVGNYVWDTGTLSWIKMTPSAGGGGGGGGPVTVADGADVTQGTLTDAAITTNTTGSISGKLRGLVAILASVWDSVNGRLKVDGSAVTQPISGTVGVSGSVAVTGPLTDTQLRATAVPVSGTFFQATQPVSGTVGISGSVAVTGPLTDTQLRATAVPVSGTFFQATQPVSIAATVAVSGPLTDTQLRASAVPVSGTVTANVGTTNGLALDATLTGGTQKSIVRGGAKGTTVATDVTSTAEGANNQALDVQIYHSGAAISPLTDTQLRATAVPVSAPTLTKATQGANGWSTQDLKDAGRVIKIYSATFTAATTEALVTLTPITDGTAAATATSFAVTAGKRLRLTSLSVTTKNAGAAVQGVVVVNLRMTATGAVTATSPLVASVGAGTNSATTNVVGSGSVAIPDGLELSGSMQLGISQIGTATAGNTVTLIGYEY